MAHAKAVCLGIIYPNIHHLFKIMTKKKRILISSCTAGFATRYNAKDKHHSQMRELSERFILIPFCPEQAGGLPTPREPAEIEQGKEAKDVLKGSAKIYTKSGKDVTDAFLRGARMALEVCRLNNVDMVILQSKSPSCALRLVYDGSFSGNMKEGMGITAQLLVENGYAVVEESEIGKILLEEKS